MAIIIASTDPEKDKPKKSKVIVASQPVEEQTEISGQAISENYSKGFIPFFESQKNYVANQQGGAAEFGNMLGESVIGALTGTVETISYWADLDERIGNRFREQKEYENWLGNAMKDLKATGDKALPVYKSEDNEQFNPSSSEWWLAHGGDTIGSVLGLMLPGLGVAKIGKLAGLGTTGQAISGAIASRTAESTMEANEAFKTAYATAKQQGKNEEDAKKIASAAGAKTYDTNWVFALQDVMQFNALTKGFKTTAKGMKGQTIKNILGLAENSVSEGAEEGGQYIVQKEAVNAALNTQEDYFGKDFEKRLTDYIDDDEFKTSIALGAAGGVVFQGAGKVAGKPLEFAAEKINNIVKRGLQREQANSVDDTATSQKTANIDAADQLIDRLNKGKLNDYVEELEEQAKQSDLTPEGRENIAHQIEDTKQILTEQSKLKNSPIPADLHKPILLRHLEKNQLTRLDKQLTKEVTDITQTLINSEELSQGLVDIKKLQLTAKAYNRLAQTTQNPEIVQKAATLNKQLEALVAESKKNELFNIAFPDLTKSLITTKDDELDNKIFQLVASKEKSNNIINELKALTTKEGIAKARQQETERKVDLASVEVLNNPTATKEQILQAASNTKNEQLKVQLAQKNQQLIDQNKEKNKEELNKKAEEVSSSYLKEPEPVLPEFIDPTQYEPALPEPTDIQPVEVEPEISPVVEQVNKLDVAVLASANTEVEKRVTNPTKQEKKLRDKTSRVTQKRIGVASKIKEYQGKRDEQGNFIKSEEINPSTGLPNLEVYKNYNTDEVGTIYDVLATDDNGQLIINTPLLKSGDTIELVVMNGFLWLQGENNTFRPSSADNYIINGYALDEKGERLYDKPVLQLPNSDKFKKDTKEQKDLRQLRSLAISANDQRYKTKISSKSIGALRLTTISKSLDVLEFDYVQSKDKSWNFRKISHAPVLAVINQDGVLQLDAIPAMNGMDNTTKSRLQDSLGRIEQQDLDNARGGVVVFRTAADGSFRPVVLDSRKLNDQEQGWVKDNLSAKLNQNDLVGLEQVVYIEPTNKGVFLNHTELFNKSRQRVHFVRDSNEVLFSAQLGKESIWISLDTKTQLDKFIKGQGAVITIHRRGVKGEKKSLDATQAANLQKRFLNLLANSNRNVPKENLNSEIVYTDPVTTTQYPSYYEFLKKSNALTTKLSGNTTKASGIESSYSVDDAVVYLDHTIKAIEIITENDKIKDVKYQQQYNDYIQAGIREEQRKGVEPLKPEESIASKRTIKPKLKPAVVDQVSFKAITTEELDWFKNNIGEQFLSVVNNVDSFIAENGRQAFGLYYNHLVKVARFSPSGTVRHEAIHFFLDPTNKLVSPAQREKILSEGYKRYGIAKDSKLPSTKINPEAAFKTWDLGYLEGTPQTDEVQESIDNILINYPDDRVYGGESFNKFSSRVIGKVKEIIERSSDGTVVVTHNTVYGLIKLWNKFGRPKDLDKTFRETYTKQDSETASHFSMEGKNGIIFVVRHGETNDNVAGNFRSNDTELTEKGVSQVKKVAKELAKHNISNIIASSLSRAIHSSKLIKEIVDAKSNIVKGSELTSEELVEEAIANEFESYRTVNENRSIPSAFRKFFRDLYSLIRNLFGLGSVIEQLFYNVQTKPLTINQQKVIVDQLGSEVSNNAKYKLLPGFESAVSQKEAIDGFSFELMEVARTAANDIGIDVSELFRDKEQIKIIFNEVKDKFRRDFDQILSRAREGVSTNEADRYVLYLGMGIGKANHPEDAIFEGNFDNTSSDGGFPIEGFQSKVLRNLSKWGFSIKLFDGTELDGVIEDENQTTQNESTENGESAERIHDLDHTTVNPSKGISQRLRLWLSTIGEPILDQDGNPTGEVQKTIFGTPKPIDFRKIYGTIVQKSTNSTNPLVRLEELAQENGIIKLVYESLLDEKAKGNEQLYHEALMNFKLSTYEKNTSLIETTIRAMSKEERKSEAEEARLGNRQPYFLVKETSAKWINTDQSSPARTIKNYWRSEAINTNVINSSGEVYNKTRQKFIIDTFNKFKGKERNSKDFKSIKEGLEETLYQLGASVSPLVWKDIQNSPTPLNKIKYLAFGTKSSSLERLIEDYSKGIDPYSDSSSIISTLADLEAKHAEVGSAGSYLDEEGKQQNPINLPSHITEIRDITLDENAKEDLLEFFKQDSFYYQVDERGQGVWNNEFLKEISKGDPLQLKFPSVTSKDDSIKGFEDRGVLDSYIMRFVAFANNSSRENKSSKAAIFVGTPADKGKQPTFALRKYNTAQTAKDFFIQTLVNTMDSERLRIQRINKFLQIPSSGNKVSTADIANYKNANKFLYISDLNSVANLSSSISDGEISIEDYKVARQKALEVINTYAERQYDLFLTSLEKNDLISITQSKDNKRVLKDLRIPNGVYNFENTKPSSQVTDSFLREFFFNDAGWRLEMSKFFQGDYAFYKNTDDYFKRQYQLVTPGYIGFSLKNNTVTRGVYSKQEKINSPEYILQLAQLIDPSVTQEELTKGSNKPAINIAKRYTKVNKTDAQSLMTVGGARILTGHLGQWSDYHELVYKFAWSKGLTVGRAIKEALSKDEITEDQAKDIRYAAVKAIQPVKPFQFNNREITLPDGSKMIVKEQFKDSITLITPELINSHQGFRDLAEYMNNNAVDIMSAEDTLKVGSYGLTDLNGSKDTWKPLEEWQKRGVSLKDIRFPQILPDGKKKEEVSLSQLAKLILGNVTDKKIIKNFNNLWNEKIKDQAKELFNDLGVNEDLQIDKEDQKKNSVQMYKLYSKIKNAIIGKDLNENYEDAIELIKDRNGLTDFKLPLSFPAFSNMFQNIISNFWSKSVMKIKSAGYSAVNLADWGVGYSDELAFMKKDEHGEVYSEVALSLDFVGSIGLKYKDHILPNGDIMWGKLNKEQKEALQFILYRIPTSNKSSMIPVRVKKILPKQYANVVMIPGELTIQQGLDFDVDKSQLLRRVLLKDGKIDRANVDTRLFDLYWDVLNSPEFHQEVLTPLDTPTLQADVARYESQGLIDHDRESSFFTPQVDVYYEIKNKYGKREIGINSRFNTGHSVIQSILDYVKVNAGINIRTQHRYTFDQLGRKHAADGSLISENFGETQQAALDAAKTPLLSLINVVKGTMAAYQTMLSFGVPISIASDFFMQPVIKEWTKFFEQEGEYAANATDRLLTKYPAIKKQFISLQKNNVYQVTDGNLRDNLSNTIGQDARHDAGVLVEFLKVYALSQQMTRINNVLSIDTTSDLNSIEALEAIKAQVDTVTNSQAPVYIDKQIFNLDKAPVEGKRIASFYHYGVESPLIYLSQLFPSPKNYILLRDQVATSIGQATLVNQDFIKTLHKFSDFFTLTHDEQFWESLSKVHPLKEKYSTRWTYFPGNFNKPSIYEHIQSVIQKLEKNNPQVAKALKDNGIIRALEPKETKANRVGEVGIRNTDQDKSKVNVISGWRELLNASNDEIRGIGHDLVRYTIQTSAFNYGTSTFFDLIPLEFWEQSGIIDLWKSKSSAIPIDNESAIVNFARHKALINDQFPHIFAFGNDIKEKSSLWKDRKLKGFTLSNSYIESHEILPRFVTVEVQGTTKLYESSSEEPTRFLELQPSGARNFYEVSADGRQRSVNPAYTNKDNPRQSDYGSPNPWLEKDSIKQYPLFDTSESGSNEHISQYLSEDVTPAKTVIERLLATEVNPENKADLGLLLRNVDKINTPVVISELENKFGVFEVQRTDSGIVTEIKINSKANVENDSQMRHILLHELDHAYFAGVIENPQSEVEKNFVTNLDRLRKETIDKYGKIQGTENNHEFNAEIASNPDFRDKLKKGDLWSRFLRFIRRIFGQKETYDKIIEQRYEIVDQVEDLQRLEEGKFAMSVNQVSEETAKKTYKKELKLLEEIIASNKAYVRALREQKRYEESKEARRSLKSLEKLAKENKISALAESLKQDLINLSSLSKAIDKLDRNPAKTNSTVLWKSQEQLQGVTDRTENFAIALERFPEYFSDNQEEIGKLKSTVQSLQSEIRKLKIPIKRLSLERIAHISKEANPNMSTEDIKSNLEVMDFDLTMVTRLFDSPREVRDPLLRTMHKLISDKQTIADRLSTSQVFDKTETEWKTTFWEWDENLNKREKRTFEYRKVGLDKALKEYETWLTSKGKNKNTIRDKFAPILNQDSFKQNSNQIEFVSPTSTEGKKILSIKKDSQDYPLKQFYTSFVLEYLRSQEAYTRDLRPGLRVPTVAKGWLEGFATAKGITGAGTVIKRQALNEVIRRHTETEFKQADQAEGYERQLPIRFSSKTDGQNGRLSKDEVSLDIAETISLFLQASNTTSEMEKIQPDLELILSQLKDRKLIETRQDSILEYKPVPKTITSSGLPTMKEGVASEAYQMAETLNKMQVLGQVKKDEGTLKIGDKHFDIRKVIDTILKYTGLKIMVGSIALPVVNRAMSEIQLWKEAVGGNYISATNYAAGLKLYKNVALESIKDMGNKVKQTEFGRLYTFFNPIGDQRPATVSGVDSTWMRTVWDNIIHGGSALEYQLSVQIMGAVMDKEQFRITETDGKLCTMADGILVNNKGQVTLKPRYKYRGKDHITEDELNEVRDYVLRFYQYMNGPRNLGDSAQASHWAIGAMVTFMRRWLVPGVQTRFRKLDLHDLRLQAPTEGHYLSAGIAFNNMFNPKDGFFQKSVNVLRLLTWMGVKDPNMLLTPNELQLNEDEREAIISLRQANIRKSLFELYSIATLTLGLFLMSGEDDDDNYAKYLALRVRRELVTFIDPVTAWDVLRSPTVALNTIDAMGKLIYATRDAVGAVLTNEDMKILESGPGKGYNELYWRALGLTPLRQFHQLDPETLRTSIRLMGQ